MSGKRFDVEWDDFSGGLYVGPIGTKQPKNTWTGIDVMACNQDGTLMPAGHLFEAHTSNPVNNMTGINSMTVVYNRTSGTYLCYAATATAWSRTAVDSWPAAINSTTIPNTGEVVGRSNSQAVFSYSGLGALVYAQRYGVPANGGINIFYPSTGLYGSANTPAIAVGTFAETSSLCVFGQFVCAFGFEGSAFFNVPQRFYFSAPGDVTVWPNTNYVDVCPVGQSIRCMVVSGSELLVGCTDGWYAISGVLGATAATRKISNDGVTSTHMLSAAVVGDGVVVAGPYHNGVVASILRGSTVSPLLYHRDDGETLDASFIEIEMRVVRSGAHTFMAVPGPPRFFVRSPKGAWRVHTNYVGAMAYSEVNWSKYGYAAVYNGANYIISRYELEPTSPVCRNAAGAWRTSTATATLSEFQANKPFQVEEMLVEVDLGFGGDSGIVRSVGLTALTRGMPLEGSASTAFDAKASTTQTRVLTLGTAANNERAWFRCKPNDGGDTYTLQPQVTMSGVKVRRVIARCKEVES